MLLPILALVAVSYQPPAPTVGDPVTVTFAAPVVLERSEGYEVVSARGNQVVIRTFVPEPIVLSGTAGNVRFRNLQIPVKSVLQQGDLLVPAPLVPPREVAYPRRPFVAIAIAALLAVATWLLVWWRSRKRVEKHVPLVPADVRFRETVLALRDDASRPLRWAALDDATRALLAAMNPNLGAELTTAELLRRTDDPLLADILRQGDLEKFSPWGALPRDFHDVATRALSLAPEKVEEEVAA